MSAPRDEDEPGSGDDAAGTAASPAAAPPEPGPSRAPFLVAVLALLVALGAAGAAAWPWWQARRGQDPASALAARVGELEARLDERVAAITAAADRAEASASALRAELEGLEAREASFAELREAFAELSAEVAGTRPVDEPRWRIAEAHYLLRIADQRARMERDPEGARSLLEAADAILAELDEYGLFPVREAIADALAALRARGGVDRVGLYLELEALEARVDALPAGRPEFAPAADRAAEETAVADDAQADGALRALGERVSGLFDFRVHRDAPIRPLAAPDEVTLLRHNLRLKLEQAQLALLRGDGTVWSDALADAARWVRSGFDGEAAQTRAFADALARLAAARVALQIPDVSEPAAVLEALRGRGAPAGRAGDDGT